MRHYQELDLDILSLQKSAGTPVQGGIFLHALRKLAAPGEAAPDQNLATHTEAVASGDEASPADAEALYQQATPDTSGHLEGEFAVPVDQAVMTMAQLVSHELKLQLAYLFYAEMLRGLNRDLSKVFGDIAKQEIEDAQYLLKRISVLMPGGVQIPIPPSPTPMVDPVQILNQMIAGEQQAIVLLKALHSQMGENPMKYTVEEMLSEEQGHLDKLWQFMPAGVPMHQSPQPMMEVAQVPAAAGPKLAAAIKIARRKSAQEMVPAPGSEPIESYVQREHQLSLAQSEAERQDLAARLQQAQNTAAQVQMMAEQSNMSAQQAAMQASQAMQQAAAQQQMAQAAQTATTQAQAQAAAEAEAKMRLSVRLSQIRQQLANMASQDAAGEEGLGMPAVAGPGDVSTATQQQQQMAQQQAIGQLASEQMAAMQQGGPRAKEETAEAQRASQEAQIQGQQAAISQATGA
jgi:rubrerythrin